MISFPFAFIRSLNTNLVWTRDRTGTHFSAVDNFKTAAMPAVKEVASPSGSRSNLQMGNILVCQFVIQPRWGLLKMLAKREAFAMLC